MGELLAELHVGQDLLGPGARRVADREERLLVDAALLERELDDRVVLLANLVRVEAGLGDHPVDVRPDLELGQAPPVNRHGAPQKVDIKDVVVLSQPRGRESRALEELHGLIVPTDLGFVCVRANAILGVKVHGRRGAERASQIVETPHRDHFPRDAGAAVGACRQLLHEGGQPRRRFRSRVAFKPRLGLGRGRCGCQRVRDRVEPARPR